MVDSSQIDATRRLRAVEYFPWYDSVVVGPGANDQSTSWFNSFAAMANSDRILFFRGNGRTVGLSYSNNANERLDFAYTIYGAQVDFFAPIGTVRGDSDPIDFEIMPLKWLHDLPQRLSLTVKIAGTDELFTVPAVKFPAGGGVLGQQIIDPPNQMTHPGINGLPMAQNMWVAPEPFELPASQTLTVEGKIDAPLRGTMQQLVANPKSKAIPYQQADGQAAIYFEPNWFVIRFTFIGAAHRQLRGARSAAGATAR